MQVLNRASEGLKRNYTVLISPEEIDETFVKKLKEKASKIRMDGFRPGKVPLDLIKRLHGEQIRRETVKDLIKEVSQKIIRDEGILISFDFQTSILKEHDKGIEYALNFEAIPTVDLKPVSDIKLTRYIAEIGDKELSEFFDNIRKNHKNWIDQPEDTIAEDGDEVSVSLSATIKVKKNEENISTDMKIVIGDPSIMPDFWQPLMGKKAGDVVDFSVTYSKAVENKKLAGKTVNYKAVVNKIAKSTEFELNDDFAKHLGYEDFSKLKEWALTKLREHYDEISQGVLKRTLLEKISDMYDFEVPENMFRIEHADVRKQLVAEAARLKKPMSEAVEQGCVSIATTRVRLGFIVAEISKKNKITVSSEEIAQGIRNLASLYPGHEQEIWNLYSRGAGVNAIVGPILEDKVVEYLLSNITIDEETCSTEKLKELDEETFDFFKDNSNSAGSESDKASDTLEESENDSAEEKKEEHRKTEKAEKQVKKSKETKAETEETAEKKKTSAKKTSSKKH